MGLTQLSVNNSLSLADPCFDPPQHTHSRTHTVSHISPCPHPCICLCSLKCEHQLHGSCWMCKGRIISVQYKRVQRSIVRQLAQIPSAGLCERIFSMGGSCWKYGLAACRHMCVFAGPSTSLVTSNVLYCIGKHSLCCGGDSNGGLRLQFTELDQVHAPFRSRDPKRLQLLILWLVPLK